MTTPLHTLRAGLLALLLAPACAWADGDADPQPNDEIQGKWVLVTNTSSPSATAPVPINREFTLFGIVRRAETSSGTASGTRPVTLTIQATTWSNNANGNSVTNNGSASLTEVVTWEWQPTNAPIQNKDVLMNIGGTATGTVAVQITGNDGGDGASASVAFDAAGSGNVGGQEIIAMATQPPKKLEAAAFISASEASSSWGISGELKKTKGGGSVGGQAGAASNDSQTFQGEPSKSQSITISAAITASGNTNNVKVYGFTLTQGLTGSVAAGNSGFDNATSSITSSTNFVMSSN